MNSRVVFGPVLLIALLLASAETNAQAPIPQGQAGMGDIQVPPYKHWTAEQAVVNLKSSDKPTRLAALRRLATEKGPTIHTWISEAARYDPEPRIRYEAVQILAFRNEPESLPILMHVADTDKDDRVRTAAKMAVNGVNPSTPPSQAQPAQPQPAQPVAPTPPPQTKRFDEQGNELPPNYLDMDQPAPAASQDGGWDVSFDEETVKEDSNEGPTHSGFLPSLGFDGALGTPRDTLSSTSIGMQIGFEQGSYFHDVDSSIAGNKVYGYNDFKQSDFSLMLMGRWSPIKFLELGLDVELLTAEKLEHKERWELEDGTYLDPNDDASDYEDYYNKTSYSGGAFGLLSFDIKSVFIQKEKVRAGLAFRLTFPTHTGDKFGEGIGASDLYLPIGGSNIQREKNETADGTLWGMEPGFVLSVAPIDSLTLYTDITFMVTMLKYNIVVRELNAGTIFTDKTEIKATNLHLTPHIGVQYKILDDTLGFQLAIAPVIYMGKENDSGMASFGIVPGISYRIADTIDLNLVFNIEAGPDAPKPFVCVGLKSDSEYQENPPTNCGVGRRFGFALSASYSF